MAEEKPNPIYEEEASAERNSPQNGNSIMRCPKPLKTPLLSDIFSQQNPLQWPIKVNFPGWRKPQSNWCNWVEKVSLNYAKIWEQTGICDAILSSLFEIKSNPEIVLALCEFWCTKTNTFIFPWGEATITLEDVMILAGLPVLGEPVNSPLSGDSMKNLEQKLIGIQSKCRTAKRVSYSNWLKYFNEDREEIESVEHVGFLSYWLSRFVFPDLNKRTVGKHVFRIAVLLSLGVKLSLASAVLACLYQNLTFLAQNASDCCPSNSKKEVSIPGPFWIVQIWALERFPLLGSKLAKPLSLGHPRIARWAKVVSGDSLVSIRSTLKLGDGFQWCPYALHLENWRHRSFYPVNELIISDCSALDDEELKSLWVCLHPQELVGIDCAEMYCPQRVLMQFGYECSQDKGSMIVPWSFHNPRMSERYKKWWKESMGDCLDANSKGLEQEGSDHKKPTLTNDLVKLDFNCEGGFLSKGLEQEDSDKKNSQLTEDDLVQLKLSLNSEGECLSKGLEQDGSDHDKPTMKDDLKNSKALEQEDSDGKNPTLTEDIVKSDLSYEGEYLPNTVEASTPRSEILDGVEDGSGRKRKFCSVRENWSSKNIVFVDLLDEEDAEKLGDKKVIRSAEGTADNPLYISDQCRHTSIKARKAGISLQSPIDVENYNL